MTTSGDVVGRDAVSRVLHAAGLSWERVKGRPGEAKAGQRVEHVERLGAPLRAGASPRGDADSHLHRDLD